MSWSDIIAGLKGQNQQAKRAAATRKPYYNYDCDPELKQVYGLKIEKILPRSLKPFNKVLSSKYQYYMSANSQMEKIDFKDLFGIRTNVCSILAFQKNTADVSFRKNPLTETAPKNIQHRKAELELRILKDNVIEFYTVDKQLYENLKRLFPDSKDIDIEKLWAVPASPGDIDIMKPIIFLLKTFKNAHFEALDFHYNKIERIDSLKALEKEIKIAYNSDGKSSLEEIDVVTDRIIFSAVYHEDICMIFCNKALIDRLNKVTGHNFEEMDHFHPHMIFEAPFYPNQSWK
jgi:hypothetical protein